MSVYCIEHQINPIALTEVQHVLHVRMGLKHVAERGSVYLWVCVL